jgi:hypothetical protein
MKIGCSFLFALLLTLLLPACHDITPNGEPCTYKITKSPATVIAIQPHDSLYAEILFFVTVQGKADTLFYTRQFPGFASNADIEKYDLRIGKQFLFEEHEIEKGNCSPYFNWLKLEKF